MNSFILLLSLFQYNVQFRAGCFPQTAIQYKLLSAVPKSGPLLQCTPGIKMLRHFRTHQKPGKILTLSDGMAPDVQTMARSGSQSLRLNPHHKTTCYVWPEPVKGERCQLPPKGKCSTTLHKNPTAQWKAGTLQGSVSKQKTAFLLCTQY